MRDIVMSNVLNKFILGCFKLLSLGLAVILVLNSNSAVGQNLQVRADLSFGIMDLAAIPGTAALGTNASITYSGGLSGGGFGEVGEIRVSGQSGTTVDISCAATATLSNGTNTITLTAIEIAVGSGAAPGGQGTVACAGVGLNVAQLTSGNNAPNTAFIGATLATSGIESSGDYDTANAGGVPILVEMVVP
jgi:hypothetical protein